MIGKNEICSPTRNICEKIKQNCQLVSKDSKFAKINEENILNLINQEYF